MSNFNLLAEVLVAEDELNETIAKNDRRRNSLIGKLPVVRSSLKSRSIKLSADQIRIEAAKTYLNQLIG
jgi:hypothetical protein